MKPETAKQLEALRNTDWFRAVGQPPPQGVGTVSSWMDAVISCAESKWETVQHDAVYLHKLALRDTIEGLSPEQRRQRDLDLIREEVQSGTFMEAGPYQKFDFPQWDDTYRALRPVVTSLVEERTKPVVDKEGLPEIVVQRATWDALFMAIEWEFSEVLPVGFYHGLALVYRAGHFPCGWEGNFPDGRLIIY